MSIVVILVSNILICNYINVVSGSLSVGLRTQLGMSTIKNSLFRGEVIYLGPKAEEIYVLERSDQTQKIDKVRKKTEKPSKKKESDESFPSTTNPTNVNTANEEVQKLDREMKKNKFCAESVLGNICQRAFKNSYFKKNKWTLEGTSKGKCGLKEIWAEKDKKSNSYDRQVVECNIKNEKGGTAFLEPSTRYNDGKNLKYFVLTDESGIMKPVAFLLNKPEPKEQKEPKDQKEAKEEKRPKEKKQEEQKPPKEEKPSKEQKPPKEEKPSKEQKPPKEEKPPKEQKPPNEPKPPKESTEPPIWREIPIEDGPASTTAAPITTVGTGSRMSPIEIL